MTISKLYFYLIWGTTGVIIFVMEFLLASHFNLLYSASYGILWAVTFVGWFMLQIYLPERKPLSLRCG
jgi:hypothetical protein